MERKPRGEREERGEVGRGVIERENESVCVGRRCPDFVGASDFACVVGGGVF